MPKKLKKIITWGEIVFLTFLPLKASAHAGQNMPMPQFWEAQFWTLMQWSIIMIALLFIASTILIPKLLEGKDLLEYPLLQRFLMSRWYPLVFQIPTLLVFGIITYILFLGPAKFTQNAGSVLTWILWWPLLPLTFVFVGRIWCAICPFPTVSDAVQKLICLKKQIPVLLKKYGIWIMDGTFIAVTWYDQTFGLVNKPLATGIVLLLLLLGTVLLAVFFERRAFCRYVCFLGSVAGNYALLSPLEIRSKDPNICLKCEKKYCYFGDYQKSGCPMSLSMVTHNSNRNCILCANCIKVCPYGNIRLSIRKYGNELWSNLKRGITESSFARFIIGIVIIQNIGMLGSWYALQNKISQFTGITNEKVLYTVVFFAALLLPFLLIALCSFISTRFSKETIRDNFARFSFAFLPLALGGHIAHNAMHFLDEGGMIIPAIKSIIFGLGVYNAGTSLTMPTLTLLQYIFIIIGAFWSFIVLYKIARKTPFSIQSSIKTISPYIVFLLLFTFAQLYIFSQPMVPRG